MAESRDKWTQVVPGVERGVHGVAERHRGRMEVDSQLGRGTTMRLCLPRTEIAAAPVAPVLVAPKSSRRIICIDDDLRVLEALQGMLRQLGHDVTTTNSGAEVIDRIGVEPIDVLITDLGMPGMDGREMAKAAKHLSPNTRVLLLTGWADRLCVTGDMPDGVDQVLGKPITKAQLQQALA